MKYCFFVLTFFLISLSAYADDQKVYGDYASLKIEDDVKWIEETSIQPENYIGQIFLVKKDNSSIPFFAPVLVPIISEEEPTVKKSILIKSSKEGSVSFLELFKVSGQKESVYQFQIVNSKKWSANTRSPEYIKAVSGFRNDPTTSGIFESTEYVGVVMVTGVVAKKIWYKAYKKDGWSGGGTYYVKIDGSNYSSSEDYEETIKYGLLLRPISGFGYSLPKAIVNAKQVNDIGDKAKLDAPITKSLNQGVQSFVNDKVLAEHPILKNEF